MSDPFVAEIRILPFSFAPMNWAFCDGQLIAIRQNTALFSLLGTTFGGDGKVTFALPQLQTCCVVGAGQGPGLQNNYYVGETGGAAAVVLSPAEGGVHTHAFKCLNPLAGDATDNKPSATGALAKSAGGKVYNAAAGTTAPMNPGSIGASSPPSGSGQPIPHTNLMPFLGLNYCIALQGVFPQRP